MSNKPNAPFVAAQRIDLTHVLITRMIDDSPRPWTVFRCTSCRVWLIARLRGTLLRPERRPKVRLLLRMPGLATNWQCGSWRQWPPIGMVDNLGSRALRCRLRRETPAASSGGGTPRLPWRLRPTDKW